MMRHFTKITAILLLVIAFNERSIGQQIVLKIDAPENAKGLYALIRSGFGPQTATEFSGPLALASPIDACSAITNDLTGQIAMLNRGTCANPDDGLFVAKVKRAQNKGAIAVLICNSDAEITTPGGTDATITIPSFIMEKSDCEKIKLAVGAGAVTGNFIFRPCEPLPPANSIWGSKQGEGDFNNGLNGWTITTDPGKGFEWTPDGAVGQNAFIADNTFMQTPTICNGAVVFNSDFLDNGGVTSNQGGGTCPSPCISSLISPNIDLSGTNVQGLTVQFSSSIRHFAPRATDPTFYYLMVSTDNGGTWSDTFNIMGEYPVNGPVQLNERVRVALCGVTATNQIRFRFHCVGNYYFWGIDDVFLINDAQADPQVNQSFYAVAPQYKTPVSQAQEIAFLADVRNNGAIPSTNTVLTVDVLENNTSIYKQDLSYSTLAPCQQVENVNFANLYNQPAKLGTYTIRYDINSDGNSNSSNDVHSANFIMTDDIFSRMASEAEFGSNYLGSVYGGATFSDQFASWANYYWVPKGDGHKATSVTFGAGDGNYSAIIFVSVYKSLGDVNADGGIDETERVYVGGNTDFNELDGTMADRRKKKILIYGVDDTGAIDTNKPLLLEDESGYIVALDVFASAGGPIPMLGVRSVTTNAAIRNFFYGATNLAFEQLGEERHSTMVSSGGTSSDDPTKRTFGDFGINELYMEWRVVPEATGTEDIKSDLSFEVYPNPVNDVLFVDMNLDKLSSNVNLEVYDLAGKKLSSANFNNIRTEKLTLSASALNTGMYVLKVTTDEGFTSRKFSVTR